MTEPIIKQMSINELIDLDEIFDGIDENEPTQQDLELAAIERILSDSEPTDLDREVLDMEFDLDSLETKPTPELVEALNDWSFRTDYRGNDDNGSVRVHVQIC